MLPIYMPLADGCVGRARLLALDKTFVDSCEYCSSLLFPLLLLLLPILLLPELVMLLLLLLLLHILLLLELLLLL